jgi:hypothetical protein
MEDITMRRVGLMGIVLAGVLLMGAESAQAGKLLDKVLGRHWVRHGGCCCQMECCLPTCCGPVADQPGQAPIKAPPSVEKTVPPAPSAVTPPAPPTASPSDRKPADKPATHKPAEKPAEKPVTKPLTSLEEGALRTWTDISGRHQIEAALLTFASGVVRIREPNGQIYRVNISKLSMEDQEYVLKTSEGIARTW